MTSVIDSSRRSGSSGPRPMISSVICSSIRTRSARVRARPSSSMTLPKISSIWRRTSTWLDRSSFGSRSWMTRFWIRNLTSRNDSRTGRLATSAAAPPAVGGGPPPAGAGRFGAGRAGRRASGAATRSSALDPLQQGHRLHPFSPRRADSYATVARSAPCEQRLLLGGLAGRRRRPRPATARRRPTGPAGGCPGRPAPPGC